jgi:enterochelin esterase-like enzyme
VELREFTWRETDPGHPAQDVMVRLTGLADWYDDRELARFLMSQNGDGLWSLRMELPDGLRTGYQFCPVRDFRIPPSGVDDDHWEAVLAAGIPDPQAAVTIPALHTTSAPKSLLELPGALPQPWCARRPDIDRGEVMVIGPDRQWPATVHIYTPPTPDRQDLPVVVLLDGQAWIPLGVTDTFDNLIADRVVPPFIAAVLGQPFGPLRRTGLTRPGVHLRYLLDDLMPWLVGEFFATTDPARTVLCGQSLGGLAAVNAGLTQPSRFGKVLAQSSALWWRAEDKDELSGADVIARASAPSTVQFWLEIGAFEEDMLQDNRDLHAALAQHTKVSYREYAGGHDFVCWQGGLADGLIELLG